jgi:hypothetical protein
MLIPGCWCSTVDQRMLVVVVVLWARLEELLQVELWLVLCVALFVVLLVRAAQHVAAQAVTRLAVRHCGAPRVTALC